MKLTGLNSDKLVNFSITKYLIDWNRAVSRPQKLAKDFLRPFWKSCVVLEEARIPQSLLRVDLMNLSQKIIVEVSPRALHVDFNKFMHQNRGGYLKKLQSDAKKLAWAEKNGFFFMEWYDEDLNNLSPEYLKEKFGLEL